MTRLGRGAATLLTAATLVLTGVAPAGASSEDTKREIEQLVDEIERLGEQADRYAEEYAAAVDDKSRLDGEVADAQARVAAKQAEVDALGADLAEMAVEAFVGGGGGGTITTLMSGGQGPNDAVQREQFSAIAYDSGAATANDYEEKVRDLDAERADLEEKRTRAADLAAQISGNQAKAEDAVETYKKRKAAAEIEYGEQLRAEEEARQAEAERQAQEAIAKAQAAARAAAEAATARPAAPSDTSSGGGGRGGGSTAGSGSSTGGSGTATAPTPPEAPPAPNPQPAPVDPNAGAGGGSSLGAIAVSAAMAQLGVPYKFATSSPGVSFDCSGLTAYAWGQAGVSLPRQSKLQFASTPAVSLANLAPGDLIFYYSPISHVSMYIGNGQVIHAPATGDVVKISALSGNAVGATRPG